MRIATIRVYQRDMPLPFVYRWSGGRSLGALDSTLVEVETDTGLIGMGDSCPWGNQYVPAFAGGVRAGLDEIGPALIGADPRCLADINRRMDETLYGHPYVKHAVDVACWDILGQHTDMPIHDLLGGRLIERVRARIGTPSGSPGEMVAQLRERAKQGYFHFSLKVGDEVELDIERLRALADALGPGQTMVADANGGWQPHEAVRVLGSVAGATNIYVEQPCRTYEECLQVRRATALPMILDECIVDVDDLLRAHADKALDILNIKIPRVGGITRCRQIRDLCVSLGIGVYLMDTGNTEIAGAVTMHMAHSTPSRSILGVWDPNDWRQEDIATGLPVAGNGHVWIEGSRPGLGLTFDRKRLGEPVAVYQG